MVFGVAHPTPDGVLKAQRVVVETQDSSRRSVSSDEPQCLDVFFAHGTTAELTDGSRLFFALDAFHMQRSELTQPEVKSREIQLNSDSTLITVGVNRQA